jgi:hypothetical protein
MKARSSIASLVASIAVAAASGCGGSGDDNSVSDPYSGSSGGHSGSYAGGATGSVSKGPDSEYVGSWDGTWTFGGAVTNHGGIAFTVNGNGALSGKMLYASAVDREVLGPGTITGQVNGSAVTFVMKFTTSLACTGTFGGVVGEQTKVSFTIDDSRSVPGSFTVTKQ